MTRTHLVLLLAAGTVVGAVSGWLRPVPGMDGTADGESPRWFLPPAQVLERSSATQFTAAQGLRWMGDASATSAAGSEWTLQGVLHPENAILIRVGNDPLIKRVASGGTLPDGSRLAAVERDAAVIERDGCQTRRNLYPRPAQTETESDGCSNPAHPQDVTQP